MFSLCARKFEHQICLDTTPPNTLLMPLRPPRDLDLVRAPLSGRLGVANARPASSADHLAINLAIALPSIHMQHCEVLDLCSSIPDPAMLPWAIETPLKTPLVPALRPLQRDREKFQLINVRSHRRA